MKKRVWALLLAVVLAFSVLAGCAKQENTPADTKEPSNQTDPTPSGDDKTDAPAEASQDVFPLAETYNVSAFAFGNTGEELDKTLTMQVMEERTNIHWDISTASQAELSEKRGLSFNSGEYYDVYIKSGISATEAFQYGSQGILIPLNDLIDQYMPNLKALLDEQDLWNQITSADGNIYALPQLNGQELAAPAVYINQKWLDNLGMKLPTTQDEFLDVLRAFVKDDPNGDGANDEYGIYCPSGAVEYTLPLFGVAMDYSTYSMYDNGNAVFVPTSDVYHDFLAFWAQAYTEKLINQDCFTASWDDLNAIGATSDTLGTIPTYGAYQHVGTERDEEYVGLNPFDGKHTMPSGNGLGYGALCITDKCTNPELICQWADYFYCEEGAILGRMGVAGVTFSLDDNGMYDWITDGEWGGDITSVRNKACMFGWYPAPLAKAKLFDEGNTNPEELFLYEQRKALLEYAAEPYPTLNWTEDELAERADLITTITSYYYEYMAQVITGQLDLDATWDEYLSNMDAMGASRLHEIDQAAYTRYLEG